MNLKKYLILGIPVLIILGFGVVYMTCNPISNKCFAQTPESIKTNPNPSPISNTNSKIMKKNLSPEEFNTALNTNEYKLIDIRTSEEYSEGHIKNSTQSDFYNTVEFSSFLDSLDKDSKYLIYCRSSNRSSQALKIMEQKGFNNVSDLKGGIVAWTAASLPLEK